MLPFETQQSNTGGFSPIAEPIGPPVQFMEQINEMLITPDKNKSSISVPVPNLKVKEFFVLARDEQGEPVVLKDENGRVFEKESFIFQDEKVPWIQQDIPVPEDEIFTTSFITSVLDPADRNLLAGLLDSYWFGIVLQAITKENYAYDLYHTKRNIGSIVHIDKAKDGETLRMVKTTITKGESIANWVMRQRAEEDEKKKIFGFIPGLNK